MVSLGDHPSPPPTPPLMPHYLSCDVFLFYTCMNASGPSWAREGWGGVEMLESTDSHLGDDVAGGKDIKSTLCTLNLQVLYAYYANANKFLKSKLAVMLKKKCLLKTKTVGD